MNKKNEIEILSAAVVALGSNSYCATWLAEQIPAIKMAIESDLYPQFRAYSFAESQQNARKMREDALVEADLIIADAKLNAERLTNQARTQVADIKRRAITDLTAL
jgi:cell division septum initiation protein DivIVA